jgi:hypothetical protein
MPDLEVIIRKIDSMQNCLQLIDFEEFYSNVLKFAELN